jgi:hypothetical protein
MCINVSSPRHCYHYTWSTAAVSRVSTSMLNSSLGLRVLESTEFIFQEKIHNYVNINKTFKSMHLWSLKRDKLGTHMKAGLFSAFIIKVKQSKTTTGGTVMSHTTCPFNRTAVWTWIFASHIHWNFPAIFVLCTENMSVNVICLQQELDAVI